MPYTVVVVLHDSAAELALLLRSIDARLAARPQLVVVDTGGDDGGAAAAAAWGADVLERRDNPGFGAACNAGVRRRARGRHRPAQPGLRAARRRPAPARRARRRRARGAPRAAAARRGRACSARRIRCRGPWARCSGRPLPPALLPRAPRERLEPWRAERPATVGWAIGACLAADTERLRGLGPFDPSAHLFAEDMELCLRARAAGMPTVLHPELRIRHTGGHATQRSGEPFALLARRRREVIGAARGPRALALDDARPGAHVRVARRGARAARRRRPAAGAPAGRAGRGDPGCAMSGERRGGVLAIAASGVLGGAERVLLDWLCAVAAPVTLACPPGALADAAADARPRRRPARRAPAHAAWAPRRRRARPRGPARRRRPARPRAPAGRRRRLGAAPAARRGLGAARGRGADRARARHGARRRGDRGRAARGGRAGDAVVATSAAIARAADPGARRLGRTEVIHPGVDPAALGGRPRAVRRPAARAVPGRARPLEARGPRAGDRRPRPRAPARRRRRAAARRPARLRRRAARAGRRADLAGRVRLLGHADPRDRARRRAPAAPLRRRASRSGSHSSRRSPPGGRSWRRPRAGRSRSSPRHDGAALHRPATPPRAPPRSAPCSPPRRPPRPPARRAARFDGDAAARRFAAVVARHLD